MPAELLPDVEERLLLRPDTELISLQDAGVSGGAYAMRPLKKAHLERLTRSDSKTWPPILVTRCTKGYIVIDGYHRWFVADAKGERLSATCQPFQNDTAIVEAAFEANLNHGYAADNETRSSYVYYLHVTYPKMTQVEIAAKAQVKQSTVSIAIARRDEQAKELTMLAGMSEEEQDRFKQRQRLEKSCRIFTRAAMKLLETAETLDDLELYTLLNATIETSEEKAKLAQIGRLLGTGRTTGSLLQFAHTTHSQPAVVRSKEQ